VDLIERHARSLMVTDPSAVLRPAVLQVPLEVASTSATVLALRDTWTRVPDKLLLSAARLPTTPDALSEIGSRDRAAQVVEAGLWVIVALRIRGWFDEARDYAGRLLKILDAVRAARPTEVSQIFPSLHLHAAIARLLGGEFNGAFASLREAYLCASDDPHGYIESDAASKTALAYATLGEHDRAAEWLHRYETAPLHYGSVRRHITSTAATARLLTAVDRLDLAAASAANAELLAIDAHRELFWGFAAYAQAQYALVTGALSDGLDQVRRARSLHREELGHGALAGPMLAAAETDFLLALGRGNQARAVANGQHANHPFLRVSQARIALFTGQPQEALRLATDSAWDRRAMPRNRLDMLLVHAIAAARTGQSRAAVTALQRAVDAARASGSLRPFRTVPRDELANLAAELPDAATLLADPGLGAQRDLFPASVALIALTRREQELLEQLSGALTRQQIANSLRISFNTVKVQLRGLYRKLDVESRADAVARGREYGLLR
jgi:LuxR family transcriptional regulator, maltose regulon positive regulatory protein